MEQQSLFGSSGSDSQNTLKENLDRLYYKYCVPSFINTDPIQFVYKFSDDVEKELAGFIASIMAQGRRVDIISKTNELLFKIMRGELRDYILRFDLSNVPEELASFSYFAYRNITGTQLVYIFYSLKLVLVKWNSLKNVFSEMYQRNKSKDNIKDTLADVVEELFSWSSEIPRDVLSLVPNPRKGSACKRMNMFLRWMVRKDQVDTGLWNDIIPTSKLVIPLDFHVSRISRELGLTSRTQDDWITAEEITNKLKEFDPNDPVKYDFAIFGYGVSRSK